MIGMGTVSDLLPGGTAMIARRSLLLIPALAACFGSWCAAGAEDVSSALERRVFTGPDGKALPYRLMKPRDYDPARTYPLVLFLHGAGERGTDNEAQLKLGVPEFVKRREQYPCFLVVPQCPPGGRWVEVDHRADRVVQPAEPSEPLRLTLELIDSLRKEFSIDAQRIYVTGISMGGF